MAALVPAIKQGTLKKYSRGGIMKNWQVRYFVLNQGKLSYYSKKAERYPFGEDLKGELTLYQATVSTDRKKVSNDKQIYIAGANGEKDLLIEAESAQEVWTWVEALTQHVRYCTTRNLGPSMSSRPVSMVDRNLSYVRADASTVSNAPSGTEQQREGSNDLPATGGSGEQQTVTPSPGFVIKALRTTGEKIFVNLCEAQEVPMTPLSMSIGYNKWPFLLLSPARTIVEEKEGSSGTVEISVYDAIVNPQVVAITQKNAEAKDAACARVLRLLKKQYGEDLQEDYKLPKISRRYKGDIQPFLMPVDITTVSKTRSSYHAVPANQNRRGSTIGGAIRRGSTMPVAAPPAAAAPAPGSSLERKVTEVEGYGGLARTNTAEVTPSPAVSALLGRDTYSGNNANKTTAAAPSMTNPRGSVLTRQLTEPVGASENGINNGNERRPSVKGVKSVAVQRRRSEGGAFDPANNSPTMSIDTEKMTPAQRLFYGVDVEPGRRNSERISNLSIHQRTSPGGHPHSMDSIQEEENGNFDAIASPQDDHNSSGPPRFVIPFQVTRQNGTLAKARPDKYSLGKNLSHGAKVFVMARRSLLPDNAAWLRSTEGWICERPYVGSAYRVCAPCLHGQPTHIKVVTTRFEEVDNPVSAGNFRASSVGKRDQSVSGWNAFRPSAFDDEGNGPAFQTRFFFDVFFPNRAFIRVSRTLAEVLTLRNTLVDFSDKMIKDRALKAGDICVTRDGDGELVKDVHWLLECVEGVETWLTRLVQSLSIEKCRCRAWSDFLLPTSEVDLPIMEAMLMQKKGLMSAWPEIERELEIHQSQLREE